MKSLFIFILGFLLTSCGTEAEKIKGCLNNCSQKEPDVNGKPVSQFYKQFFYKSEMAVSGKLKYSYLRSKAYPIENTSNKFWSVDLKLMQEKKYFKIRINTWRKNAQGELEPTGSDSYANIWNIKNQFMILTGWGVIRPHIQPNAETLKMKFDKKNIIIDDISDKEIEYFYIETGDEI